VEEAPAPTATQEKSVEWTLEGLADALPHGTISVEKTDMGLVLGFNSRLFYQTANRNKAMVEEKLRDKTGCDVNVVLSYSEPPEPKIPETPAPQAPVRQPEEKPAPAPEVREESPKPRPQEQKNLITDLMLCFDGREERG